MKKIPQIKQIKQSAENDKEDSLSGRSELDSTTSTIEKMQDFLDEQGVASSVSNTDAVQPMESASFPMDFGELQERYKQQKDQQEKEEKERREKEKKAELIPFKKVLESRRSDFEEIRQHLERRSQEMKKRVKKIGEVEKPAEKEKEKEDNASCTLSYHSTEFTPDSDCNARPSQSLTNKERLQILSDKCRLEQRSKETDEGKDDKSNSCPVSHAIFAHLAKLKTAKSGSSVAKPVCKLDLKVKTKKKAKARVLEVDSDPSLSLHNRDSQKSITSRTSLRSDSKHMDH